MRIGFQPAKFVSFLLCEVVPPMWFASHKVVKGSFSHLEPPFFVHRMLVYLSWPEPFPQPFLTKVEVGSRRSVWQSLTFVIAGLDVAVFNGPWIDFYVTC